ncbi:response regulator [Anaeromyxobacter paludicola]|uniref:response regulator n=1 Tax=Anaeromyxobacter paludicola TaxID=2918171 RepID=UPI0020BE1714|nr:response regulator [Anaeromyxobacter paludicola]
MPLILRIDYPDLPELRDATENLSASGLFIRTERELAIGDRVPLSVSFPGLLEPVAIEVEVVRLRQASTDFPKGLAVRVPEDRPEDRQKLARLAGSALTVPATGKHAYNLLVVEDNPLVLEMYQQAMRRIASDGVDLKVDFAHDGREAAARLERLPRVDLLMADLYMPGMDGFTLVELARKNPACAGMPIVVISAGGKAAMARTAPLGVDVFLQKPVKFGDIITTLRSLLHIA